MSALAGPLFAAALLLAAAGVGKLVRPASTRVALRSAGLPSRPVVAQGLGAAEIAIAVATLAVGGPVTAALVALAYLGFAAFVLLLRRRVAGAAPCGCFGDTEAPAGGVHLALDLGLAAIAAAAVAWPTDGITAAVHDTPWAGVPFLFLTLVAAWLLYATLALLPVLLEAMRPEGTAA